MRQSTERRASNLALRWHGSFAAYWEIVQRNPEVARHSHARLYSMLKSKGGAAFFNSELFGLDKTVRLLLEGFFRPSSRLLDTRRRILLLVGPVGSGKSTIATLLKRGLEEYSHTPSGAFYSLEGCPMHEEPLHLIPDEVRPELKRKLNLVVEGELCPICRLRLEEEFSGDITRFPVERFFISEQNRSGIGCFQPSDPKSQDIAELTGGVDFSTIGEFGSESDPRAYRFDGEINAANRGLLEMQEMLKCDERFLWRLLSLAQEGNVKTGRFPLISADEVVIGHANPEEYQAFAANPANRALHSRLFVLPVPYCLSVDDESRKLQKLIDASDLGAHIAPHALRPAATFAVATRRRKSGDLAGMTGIDPRSVFNWVCTALSGPSCPGPLDVLEAMIAGVENCLSFSATEREEYQQLLLEAHHNLDRLYLADIGAALAAVVPRKAAQVFALYRSQAKDFVETGQCSQEETLRHIEQGMDIATDGCRVFREQLALLPSDTEYTDLPELKQAVEAYFLFQMRRDIWPHSPQRSALAAAMLQTLVEEFGYCHICADKALQHADETIEGWGS